MSLLHSACTNSLEGRSPIVLPCNDSLPRSGPQCRSRHVRTAERRHKGRVLSAGPLWDGVLSSHGSRAREVRGST
jgi:hypothetical protein